VLTISQSIAWKRVQYVSYRKMLYILLQDITDIKNVTKCKSAKRPSYA
jgi:hypothetical protein